MGEVHCSPPWPPDKRGVEYARVIVYKADGQAKAEEIRALRKLNQELGRLPVNEAAKRIGLSKSRSGRALSKGCPRPAQESRSMGFEGYVRTSGGELIWPPG